MRARGPFRRFAEALGWWPVLGSIFLSSQGARAMTDDDQREQLHQVTVRCGVSTTHRLQPLSGRRARFNVRPEVRALPATQEQLDCIRRELERVGWRLARHDEN
jgi:hypothetical protein